VSPVLIADPHGLAGDDRGRKAGHAFGMLTIGHQHKLVDVLPHASAGLSVGHHIGNGCQLAVSQVSRERSSAQHTASTCRATSYDSAPSTRRNSHFKYHVTAPAHQTELSDGLEMLAQTKS
jgi:hypothetical protein